MAGPRRFRLAVLVVVLVGGLGGAAFAATGGHKAGPEEAVAFATVLEDGTIAPNTSSDNIADSNVSKGIDPTGQSLPGVYCFTNLPFLPSNAVVTGNNAFRNNDTVASVAIDITTPRAGLEGCPDGATLRVRTLDLNGVASSSDGPYDPQLMDHVFEIWIRGDRP